MSKDRNIWELSPEDRSKFWNEQVMKYFSIEIERNIFEHAFGDFIAHDTKEQNSNVETSKKRVL